MLPGIDVVRTPSFKYIGDDKWHLQKITAELASHVANTQFEVVVTLKDIRSVPIEIVPDQKIKGAKLVDDEKMEEMLLSFPVTDEQASSILEIAGQKFKFRIQDEDDGAVATVASVQDNICQVVLIEPDSEPKVWTNTKAAFTPGNAGPVVDETYIFEITVGVHDDKTDQADIYHTLRAQGIAGAEYFTVQPDKTIRLFRGDRILTNNFQCDALAEHSQISIVSGNLLATEVITQGFRQSVLHSFPLSHDFSIGADKNFGISGCGTTPPGQLTWRSRMQELIPHKLTMSGAPLRSFTIKAALMKKEGGSEIMQLPPSGSFSVSLIFVKMAN